MNEDNYEAKNEKRILRKSTEKYKPEGSWSQQFRREQINQGQQKISKKIIDKISKKKK